MNFKTVLIVSFILVAFVVNVSGKPRIWVASDMNTSNDPDDKLVLAVLLLFANEFDICGITVKDPDWVRDHIFAAYRDDYKRLAPYYGSFDVPSNLWVMKESTRNGAYWEDGFTEEKVFGINEYPSVKRMIEEASKGPIYFLNWGPMNEAAHIVKWLLDNEEYGTLDNLTIISHATRKEDNTWNYYGDPKAADYVKKMGQQGLVKFYELGASGNPMCRLGSGKLDKLLMHTSALGAILDLKWEKNGPDFSDAVTFLVLLGYFGGLDLLSSNGDWDPDIIRRAKEAKASIYAALEERVKVANGTFRAKAPVGKTIWLKAILYHKYVTFDTVNALNVPLMTIREQAEKREMFHIVDAGNGYIAFKTKVSGKYVTADFSSHGYLSVQELTLSDLACFEWIVNDDGTISLRGHDGTYVAVGAMDMDSILSCSANSLHTSGKFIWGE